MTSNNRKQKSIAMLLCHFGKMPWFFDYFIHSCKFNSSIDFFIITDDKTYKKVLPSNVKLIYKTLNEINFLATKKFGFRTDIQHSYKLCDFKPAHGLLFSELIKNYDFWGQGDIDVIYGDIRSFITDDLLDEYDFVSLRHDYTTGCFTLHRNNSFINNIFKQSKDYVKVFSSSRHYCFDECNWAYDLLAEGRSIFEVKTEIESFTHIIKSAEKNNELKAYFNFLLIEGKPGKIKFDKGKIIYKNKFEAILYHLIWFKHVYKPKKAPKTIPETFKISPSKIYLT